MSARLIPPITPLTEPYWQAARDEQLHVQQCKQCHQFSFPPRAHCPACDNGQLSWQQVSGKGTVYTYTVAYRPPHRVFVDQLPLVLAVVEIAEGPRLMTNVLGCEASHVTIGMPVQVDFEPIDDSDLKLPVFRPA